MSKTKPKEMISGDEVRIMLLEQKNDSFHETLMRIEKRLDHIDDRFNKLENDMGARFNKSENDMSARFNKLENDTSARFDKLENDMSSRFDKVDHELKDMRMHFDVRIDSNFKWLLSLVLAFGAGLLGVMSHGFHWL